MLLAEFASNPPLEFNLRPGQFTCVGSTWYSILSLCDPATQVGRATLRGQYWKTICRFRKLYISSIEQLNPQELHRTTDFQVCRRARLVWHDGRGRPLYENTELFLDR